MVCIMHNFVGTLNLYKLLQNWIGNEKGRRKRSGLSGTDPPPTKKPPQKLRAPNPYNVFVKDFFKSKGMYMYTRHIILCCQLPEGDHRVG